MKAYVVGQAALGYAEFAPGPDPSDVILTAFPKSGSTWTSYLLHQLRSGGDHDFDDIKHEVVDITPGHWDPAENPFSPAQRFHPRTFKTHGSYGLAPKGARYIYLARDPRDSLVSLYHFIHDLFQLQERAPMEAFYREYYVERFGAGHDIGCVWDHFLSWHPLRDRPEMLWIHYEDLLEDLPYCLRRISAHMGLDDDPKRIELVLERSAMDRMRAIRGKLDPSPDNYVGKLTRGFSGQTAGYAGDMKVGKMRKGVAGDGRTTLSDELLAQLAEEWTARITPALGYRDYEEMRAACSLLVQS